MNMRHAVMIVVAAWLLASCAAAPVPTNAYYTLAPLSEGKSAPLKARLMVEPFQILGIYTERPLLYRNGVALSQYRYQFWAEPPALMWRDALIDYLRNHGATNVLMPESRVSSEYVLRTRLKRVEQVLGAGGTAKALLSLEFAVADSAGKLVLTLVCEEQKALASDDPEDYVKAINELAGRAFTKLNAGLHEKLR
jgi:uncharacterized lipoprotein YmbA